MATNLRKLKINEVSLVDRGASPDAFVTLWKRDEPAGIGGDKGDAASASPSAYGAADDGKSGDKSMADNAALEAQLAELKAKLEDTEKAKADAEAKAAEATEKADKVAKAEASRIEKTEKELADLRKSHEEAVEKAEVMEFQKRAEADFPYTPGTAVEKGEALRAVHKMADGPAKDALLKSMKQAEGAFASLMREVGKAGKPVTGTAQAELDAEATKLMQAEKLSKAEAQKRVMHGNEELAKRYRDELEVSLNGH
jgi:hypothetical protein